MGLCTKKLRVSCKQTLQKNLHSKTLDTLSCLTSRVALHEHDESAFRPLKIIGTFGAFVLVHLLFAPNSGCFTTKNQQNPSWIMSAASATNWWIRFWQQSIGENKLVLVANLGGCKCTPPLAASNVFLRTKLHNSIK